MDYSTWEVVHWILETEIDDEAAYDLWCAFPWKIITGQGQG